MRQLAFEMTPDAMPFSSAAAMPVRGSFTEVIVSEGSALQPFQLLPVLAHCNARQRWLMWLSPNQSLNKQWLINAGLQDCPVLHMAISEANQTGLCLKALTSAKSHLIVEWTGPLNRADRATLRELAEENGTHLFLIRSE